MKNNKNIILLKELVKTDFKLRYQGSVMGYVWSVLKPLMLFAVMYVVFIYFLRFGADVPHFAEGIHIERKVIKLVLINRDRRIDVIIKLRKLVDIVPHPLI